MKYIKSIASKSILCMIITKSIRIHLSIFTSGKGRWQYEKTVFRMEANLSDHGNYRRFFSGHHSASVVSGKL